MHPWRRYLDWPLTPWVFPALLELPEGEPRGRAITALRRSRHMTSLGWIFVGIILLTILGAAALLPVLPQAFMDRLGSLILAAIVVLFAMSLLGLFLGPALLKRRPLTRELTWLIESGELLTCAKCSYRLQGSASPRCPECGEPVTPAMQAAIRQHLRMHNAPEAD